MQTDDEKLASALEILNIFPPALKEAFQKASGMHDEMYPDRPTSMEPGRYQNFDSLQSQFAALTQPRRQYEPIGGHVPGNEFSVSTRGLSQGVNDLIDSVDAKRREIRLFGDPARRDEMTSQINDIDAQVKNLREQANKFKAGEISTQAMQGLGFEQDESVNELVAQLEAEATALEQEKETLSEQLRQYSGVAGQLSAEEREIQREEAEVEQNRTFMDQFVQTFGSGMFEQTLQTMRDATAHGNAVSLENIRNNAAMARVRLQMQARPQASTERIPNHANTKWIGDYIKNYREGLNGEYNAFVREYLLQNPSMGTYNIETKEFDLRRDQIPEQDLVLFNRYELEMRYLDDVELARSFHADPNFDISQRPPTHHPSQQQKGKIEAMRDIGMPPEFINAFMYYNNISYNAPPLLPQESRAVNQAPRPFRFFNEQDVERQNRAERNEQGATRGRSGRVGGRDTEPGIGVLRNEPRED